MLKYCKKNDILKRKKLQNNLYDIIRWISTFKYFFTVYAAKKLMILKIMAEKIIIVDFLFGIKNLGI